MAKEEIIAILDFGSQYTQLIARRIREANVKSEIYPYSIDTATLKCSSVKGLILSGSPACVADPDAPFPNPEIYSLGKPILGICYGLQVAVHEFGGKVAAADKREYGHSRLYIDLEGGLFDSVLSNPNMIEAAAQSDNSKIIDVWMSHGDKVLELPEGFEVLAHTENASFAAIFHKRKHFYGVQFHPEVVHTPQGTKILQNFCYNICKCHGKWTMESFKETAIRKIREQVGDGRVLCALSGGVDSSVVALLVNQAVGDHLTCVFVDNGLLRKGEREIVENIFKDKFSLNLIVVDARQRFLEKLSGVMDPEKKRIIIGHEFISVFEEIGKSLDAKNHKRNSGKKITSHDFLAQGTLYPDVIESVSVKGPSQTIKSHHNVGGLPEKMGLKLIEPIRELFKDEVRILAKALDLPDEIAYRQPFPGPGLAVRLIDAVTDETLDILREADAIVQEEIQKAGFYRSLWQAFAVLLPVKSVGVMGDERTYENVIALRAVTSKDGMTADWAKLPYDLLGRISNRIINEVKGINRVVFDISSKPPATIEWE